MKLWEINVELWKIERNCGKQWRNLRERGETEGTLGESGSLAVFFAPCEAMPPLGHGWVFNQ